MPWIKHAHAYSVSSGLSEYCKHVQPDEILVPGFRPAQRLGYELAVRVLARPVASFDRSLAGHALEFAIWSYAPSDGASHLRTLQYSLCSDHLTSVTSKAMRDFTHMLTGPLTCDETYGIVHTFRQGLADFRAPALSLRRPKRETLLADLERYADNCAPCRRTHATR